MKAIEVSNLTKKYDQKYALNDLSFSIPVGSVCGFLGPNGAGKTTTMKLLMGLIKNDGGQISILGKNIDYGNSHSDIRFLQDVPNFYSFMTAYEYLKFICQLNKIDNNKIDKKIDDILELVNLKDSKKKRVGKFSRGMKQRIGIAANIISNPKILLLDEPVSALDPIGRKEVFDLIENLKEKMTIVFSTHILDDIERVCDRIVLINNGKKIIDGTIGEVKQNYLKNTIEIKFINKTNCDKFKKGFKRGNIELKDDITIKITDKDDIMKLQKDIIDYLSLNDISVMNLGVITPTLEEIFVSEVVK